MKTSKKQGLSPPQKQYLKKQIGQYLLLSVIVDGEKKLEKSAAAVSQTAEAKAKSKPARLRSRSKPPKILKPSSEERQEAVSEPEAEKIPVEVELVPVLREEPKPVPRRHFFHRIHPSVGLRRFLKVSAAAFVLTLFIQLIYPYNRSLPFSRLQAHGYKGFADKKQILKSFENFDSRVVTVHTHTKSLTTSYKDLGVTINPDQTVESMTDYSFGERLIPLSIVFKGLKTHSVSRDIDKSQLNLFVKDVIAQASKQPKDAEVTRQGTQLLVASSEEGYEYQAEVLKSQVLRSDLSDQAQLVFAPTILRPNITTDDAKYVAGRMQLRLDTALLVNAENKNFRIEPATMASWIEIVHKPEKKTVDITFNRAKVAETLRSLETDVNYSPINTIVTYLNGIQAGRLEGKVGKQLQFDDIVDRITSATSPNLSTMEASVKTLPPSEIIDRKYTRDSQGLQTLLQYWVANHKGEYSIDLRMVNGRMEASVNPHKLTPSTGVYRMYISSLVYGRIAANSISLGTVLQTGQTVDVCLDRMIRESDDNCTGMLGSLVGWGASDNLLKAQGFDSTTLAEGAGLTTANDMSDWMLKLLGSNITTRQHADAIIQKMSRQSFRSGIPQGSPGMVVANKSGAFGRLKHDAAIVYHPSGAYVLTVFSEGSDFASIADLASEINKVLSQ